VTRVPLLAGSRVVVVTTDDEPMIGPINEDALRFEAEADRRGGG
jgi:hypothetical protein